MENTITTPAETDDTLKAAVEEAEQRGYLRGLNEAASSRMNSSEMIPSPGATIHDSDDDAESSPHDFFATPRKSIWD